MSTSTTNYAFTLPAVADPIDEDLWGTELNSNWSSLDDILPTPSANKYGAIAVQNNADNGLDYVVSQGTTGEFLVSNGDDALPSFENMIPVILAYAYPIGSVYINYSDNTNPATLLGFGTWSALQNNFLIGAGGTYAAGTTGGATTHTLTAGEIPSLTYTIAGTGPAGGATGTRLANINASNNGGDVTATAAITTNAGGGSHSILNPYVAVYMWRRTA